MYGLHGIHGYYNRVNSCNPYFLLYIDYEYPKNEKHAFCYTSVCYDLSHSLRPTESVYHL